MLIPACTSEIVLQPGDWHFGDAGTRMRTVLGTCVSVVFWHAALRIGGMCHYLLPGRSPRHGGQLDGRYAEDAFELMLCEIRLRGTKPSAYQLKLFGGGDMFPDAGRSDALHVGMKNAEAARALVRRHGLHCACEHLEGVGHRNIVFDVRDGQVLMRQMHPVRLQGGERKAPCVA